MTITSEFILEISLYSLFAFGVFCTLLGVVYWTTFRNHNLSGESLAVIIERSEVPKLATIILIIVAATFLGLMQLVEGESIIAILSGIAGYVLGGRANQKKDKEP